jgi:hypothetical protein
MDQRALRAGNGALEYLLSNYRERGDKFTKALECFPDLADTLFQKAQFLTDTFLKPRTVRERIQRAFSDRRNMLSMCVFDLMLASCFSQISEYSDDNKFSSAFIDALLYQATGFEAGDDPTEEQIRHEGTHHTRGIAKYKVASNYISPESVPDLDGWILGKEYSAIVSGSNADYVRIMTVVPLAILIRAEATWDVGYFLYGTLPSKDQREKVDSLVSDLYTKLGRTL